jgi:hypothetical protein
MKYIKKTPRITVKFIDADTEEILFEIKDKTWMDVGQNFSDFNVSSILTQELKNKSIPKNILIIAVGEFKLVDS